MRSWILSACCVLVASQVVLVEQDKLSPQEIYFLRRMTEFWKDKDFNLVKIQIEEFLSTHETSSIHNNLYTLMGDILYQENNYGAALATYNKISESALHDKILSRKSQCLYMTENYDEVVVVLGSILEQGKPIDHKEEMEFIFSDSLFRKMRKEEAENVKKELAQKALPYYQALYNTSYQDKILLQLAETYRVLDLAKDAAPLYATLAEKTPQQAEDFLMQAATLQLKYDPSIALTTFQRLVDMGGPKARESAKQELFLLFQQDRYSDLISRAPKLDTFLEGEHKILLNFCLARSYFKMDLLPEATEKYKLYVEQEKEPTPHKRAAYLTLIHCAQKTENSILFDQVLAQFLHDFPKDEEAGKALLLHAQSALQRGDLEVACSDLTQLLKDFPNFPDQETLLYDQAILLSKNQKWPESRTAYLAYLEKFPTTPHTNLIWSSIVHSSVQELKTATPENIGQKKSQLANDLKEALAFSNLFSLDEEAAYQFLLGQILFEQNQYADSAITLFRFSQKFPSHPSAPEAYLLQALAYRELNAEPGLFIPAAEKALQSSVDPKHKTALSLHLFNSYIHVKQYDKAAECLYETYVVEGTDIQEQNRLWLASHLLGKGDHNRSSQVYKKILAVDDAYQLHFDPAQTYLESETFNYVKLLDPSQKETVLVSLLEMQNRHNSLPWKHQDKTLLELALARSSLQKTEEALTTIDILLAKGDGTAVSIRNIALLEKSRLLLKKCSAEEYNEENPMVRGVLSTLKDLQIQKELQNEPVHLEAALDYVDLRSSFAPESGKIEAALFFLTRMKEDFNTKDDPSCQAYHEARMRFPEKDKLFQNYMKYLEAEILSWQARSDCINSDFEKADHSKNLAKVLLEEVLKEQELTPYLKNRAEKCLHEIEK